jgi:hypothetical protein
LPFGITKCEYCLSGGLAYLYAIVGDFEGFETLDPPFKGLTTIDTKRYCRDCTCTCLIESCMRPIKKGEIKARLACFVTVEEVIGTYIILVNRFFDEM